MSPPERISTPIRVEDLSLRNAGVEHRRSDDWPHTTRILPWGIAAFFVMVFWVPFDSTTLPISLPINSDLDRFVIGFLVLIWLFVVLLRPAAMRFRAAPVNVAIYAFLVAAVASLVVNVHQLAWDGELTLSLKELSLIISYLAAYFVIATSLRPAEVRPFAKLLVFLAVGTAAGTIYEYTSGTNPFYVIARTLFVGLHVASPAAAAATVSGPGARPSITGPALHGLADATLITTAVPFAVSFAKSANGGRKLAWLLAILILLAGCFATGRKTALVVVAVAFLVLFIYEPRSYLPYLAMPVAAGLCLFIIEPHAIRELLFQVTNASTSTSTTSRTADYSAVLPTIVSHLLIGRGYGSFDPFKYRILDDQMLGWLVEVGVIGAVAYAAIMFSVLLTVHRSAKAGLGLDSRLMQSAAAASLGYLLTNFLYDTFGFRQAPYTFFIIAALAVVACGQARRHEISPPSWPSPVRRPDRAAVSPDRHLSQS